MCGFLSCLATVCCLLGVCARSCKKHPRRRQDSGKLWETGRNKETTPCNLPVVRKKVEATWVAELFTASQ